MESKRQWWNQRRNQKILQENGNENTTLQNLWDTAKAILRRKFIVTGLPEDTRKISNKQLNLPPKRIRKRTKPSQQKEGNNKDQRESK